MEAKIVYLGGYSCKERFQEDVAPVVEKMRNGLEMKFVYCFWADIFNEKIIIGIAVADILEHVHMLHELCTFFKKHVRLVPVEIDPNKLGAGRIKIENGCLVFFGVSGGLGKFDEKYLLPGMQGIMSVFGVDEVKFQ